MASARAAAIAVVSGTALLAGSIVALAGWVALWPQAGGVARVPPAPSVVAPRQHALPPGYTRVTVGGVAPTRSGNAVVLKDSEANRALLIFVGGTEALSIALRLQHRAYARPLTHDLLDRVLGEFDGEVVRAQVDRLEDGVYFGALFVAQGPRVVRLDARPSDALALALGSEAPIFVARQILDVAGVDMDELEIRDPEDVDPEVVLEAAPGQVEL